MPGGDAMNQKELEILWAETLRAEPLTEGQLDRLANAVVDVYESGHLLSRLHINRFKQIQERTGETFEPENFGLPFARAFIADEIGFTNWDALLSEIRNPGDKPILFKYAVAAMERGDFSALETMVGGTEKFDDQMIDWYEKGYFESGS